MEKTIVAEGVLHKLPDDMIKALKAKSDILECWNNLTPIQRNEWICWVTIVKKNRDKNGTHATYDARVISRKTPTLLLAWLPTP